MQQTNDQHWLSFAGKYLPDNRDSHAVWTAFERFCYGHHLRPYFIEALARKPEDWHPSIWSSEALQKHPFAQLNQLHGLRKLTDDLSEKGIPHFFAKGMLWSYELYGNFFRRQSNDIDLYIKADHFFDVFSVLKAEGYVSTAELGDGQIRYLMRQSEEFVTLYHPELNIALDLHWSLCSPYYPAAEKKLNAWYNTFETGLMQLDTPHGSFPVLATGPEKWAHLLINGYTEGWSRCDILWDMEVYLEQIGRSGLETAMDKYHLQPIVQLVTLAWNILNGKIREIPPAYRSWWMLLRKRSLNESPGPAEKVKVYFLMLRTTQKMKVIRRLLMRPTPEDILACGSAFRLSPLKKAWRMLFQRIFSRG